MVARPAVQLRCRTLEYILQKLRLHGEGALVRLKVRRCQQVFSHTDQPIRIVIDACVQSFFGRVIQGAFLLHQDGRAAADICKRGAQVMGYGAEQICLEVLLLRLKRGLAFFPPASADAPGLNRIRLKWRS